VDPRVTELHCIMPIANIGSVMQRGILSNERAAKLTHHSVALYGFRLIDSTLKGIHTALRSR
jgi:hypothetical protein